MCLKLYLSLLPRVLPPRRPFLLSAEGRLLPGFMLATSPNWAHGVFPISPSLRRKRSSDLDGVLPDPLASFLIAASRSALADLPFSPRLTPLTWQAVLPCRIGEVCPELMRWGRW